MNDKEYYDKINKSIKAQYEAVTKVKEDTANFIKKIKTLALNSDQQLKLIDEIIELLDKQVQTLFAENVDKNVIFDLAYKVSELVEQINKLQLTQKEFLVTVMG